MHPPLLEWGEDDMSEPWYTKSIAEKHVEVAAAALQEFADQILQYISAHGSKVRALAWSPYAENIQRPDLRDAKGHRWPVYTYFRGRMIDAHGAEKVVAVPIRTSKAR
jgi:hypothetical protein